MADFSAVPAFDAKDINSRIRVISYSCPVTEIRQYALWVDNCPILAANNYLRCCSHLAENTRKGKAYNLLPWFRFLALNQLNFWDLSVRSTGDVTRLFRNALKVMADRGELEYETAKKYLSETYLLCRFWRQADEPALEQRIVRRSRGVLSHTFHEAVKLPPEWTLRTPPSHRPPSDKGFLPEVLSEIWKFLGEVSRPPVPTILRSRPRSDWSDQRKRAYERAKRSYNYQRVVYHRNLALWAVMLASGMRIGEVPLLATEDVGMRPIPGRAPSDRELWIHLRSREETEHLGRSKSGDREIYIGYYPDPAVIDALLAWLRVRPLAVAQAAARGAEPHRMLFTKDDGTPLTIGAVRAVFRKLKRRLEEVYADPESKGQYAVPGEPTRDKVKMHPHLVRHTIESILRAGGIPLDIRQAHLGHRNPDTTLDYGRLYDTAYIAALSRLVQHNEQLGTSDAP